MGKAESELGFAKVDGQHADVFYGSPLALVGVFVEVIRARFRGGNAEGLPWVWREDPTPDHATQNAEAGGATLYVESQLNDDPESRSHRPAVLVDKEDTRLQKFVVGNRAGVRMTDRLEGFIALGIVPISVMCLSTSRGESAQLGDHVWFHLASGQNLIRETFNIHELTPPVLGKTQPYRRSESENDTWMTPIAFEAQVMFRWITRPIAPLLQEVRSTLTVRGDGDAVLGAITTASYSKRRR